MVYSFQKYVRLKVKLHPPSAYISTKLRCLLNIQQVLYPKSLTYEWAHYLQWSIESFIHVNESLDASLPTACENFLELLPRISLCISYMLILFHCSWQNSCFLIIFSPLISHKVLPLRYLRNSILPFHLQGSGSLTSYLVLRGISFGEKQGMFYLFTPSSPTNIEVSSWRSQKLNSAHTCIFQKPKSEDLTWNSSFSGKTVIWTSNPTSCMVTVEGWIVSPQKIQ